MDTNDLVAWLVYIALLQIYGLFDENPGATQPVFVGDAIPGATYAG